MNATSLWTRLRHVLGGYPVTAAEWSVRVQCADVSRQELLVLDAWLKSDPRNAEDYARFNKIGHLGLKMRENRGEVMRLRGYRRLRDSERLAAEAATWFQPRRWVPAACACGLLAVLVYWRYSESGDRYVVGHGSQRQIELSDGSRMTINTDSEVRVLYDQAARVIVLPRGEAFFEVAQNPSRPFIVRAGSTEIRALGTTFSVRQNDLATEVTVTEGRVRVSRIGDAATDAHELAPRHHLLLSAATGATQIETVDAARETAWASGTLEFEDAPLRQVVREVNRYTAKTFVIADADLEKIRLTARFRIADAESLKFALRERFEIRAEENSREILLRSSQAESAPDASLR
jgi:transmembrane sensor